MLNARHLRFQQAEWATAALPRCKGARCVRYRTRERFHRYCKAWRLETSQNECMVRKSKRLEKKQFDNERNDNDIKCQLNSADPLLYLNIRGYPGANPSANAERHTILPH